MRWTEIAALNRLRGSDRLLVGQRLLLPTAGTHLQSYGSAQTHPNHVFAPSLATEHRRALLPARMYMFIVADEWDPFRRKLVRKILVPSDPTLTPAEIARIARPDRHGFAPRDPGSSVSVGRHVGQNMTNSDYISASELPQGSPRFEGTPYWIDAKKAEASGSKIIESEAIVKDIDRIIAKSKSETLIARLKAIKELSQNVDREVAFKGAVPATAVKSATAMGMTRGLQVLNAVGILLTAYDLGKAGQESIKTHSVVPIRDESIRQAGGWGAAIAGAEIFGGIGAACGIETGPGAIITGAAGAVVGGIGGFMGADWAVSRLHKH